MGSYGRCQLSPIDSVPPHESARSTSAGRVLLSILDFLAVSVTRTEAFRIIMAWITPTETHLLTRMSGAELDAFRAAALGTGQADPIADQLAHTVEMARGYIAGCRQNVLGPEGTVPEKLLGAVLDLTVVEVEKRAAGSMIDPQGVRQTASREAMTILRDVAACRFVIEKPAEETTEEQMIPTPSITARARRFRSQDGI